MPDVVEIDLRPFVARHNGADILPSLLPIVRHRDGTEDLAKIAISIPQDFKPNSLDTQYGNTNIQGLLSGGYSGLYNIALSVDTQLYCGMWNLYIYEKVKNPLAVSGSLIKEIYWGVGARIGIIAWSRNSELSLTTNSRIAAATTLNLARSCYNILVSGGSPSVMGALQPLIQTSMGEFNMDTMAIVGQVKEELADVLRVSGAQPVPLKASVDATLFGTALGCDPLMTIGSSVFAAERIDKGKSCNGAKQDTGYWRKYADFNLVLGDYQDIFRIIDPNKEPSNEERRLAAIILRSALK